MVSGWWEVNLLLCLLVFSTAALGLFPTSNFSKVAMHFRTSIPKPRLAQPAKKECFLTLLPVEQLGAKSAPPSASPAFPVPNAPPALEEQPWRAESALTQSSIRCSGEKEVRR